MRGGLETQVDMILDDVGDASGKEADSRVSGG